MPFNTYLLVPKAKMENLMEKKCEAEKNLKIHQANFFDLQNGKMQNINTAGKVPNSILRKTVGDSSNFTEKKNKSVQINTVPEDMSNVANNYTASSFANPPDQISSGRVSNDVISNAGLPDITQNFNPQFNSSEYGADDRTMNEVADRSIQTPQSLVANKSLQVCPQVSDKQNQNLSMNPAQVNRSVGLNRSMTQDISMNQTQAPLMQVPDEFCPENVPLPSDDIDDPFLTSNPYWISSNRKLKSDIFSLEKPTPYKKVKVKQISNLNRSKIIKDLVKKNKKKNIETKKYVPHIKTKRSRSNLLEVPKKTKKQRANNSMEKKRKRQLENSVNLPPKKYQQLSTSWLS